MFAKQRQVQILETLSFPVDSIQEASALTESEVEFSDADVIEIESFAIKFAPEVQNKNMI